MDQDDLTHSWGQNTHLWKTCISWQSSVPLISVMDWVEHKQDKNVWMNECYRKIIQKHVKVYNSVRSALRQDARRWLFASSLWWWKCWWWRMSPQFCSSSFFTSLLLEVKRSPGLCVSVHSDMRHKEPFDWSITLLIKSFCFLVYYCVWSTTLD